MNNRFGNAASGYGTLSVALHWLMLLLIAATYALMELKTIYPRGSHGREVMAAWHFMLGMSVFALVWVRLWARNLGAAPEVKPAMPAMHLALAKFVHWALYALMIGLPLLGWLSLSAKGAAIPFWGLELPALIGKNNELAGLFKDIHETLATAGYFLIGLHAAAALFHHYIKRDNTLSLMVPRLRR